MQTIGIKEADHAQIAMKEADLVVAIGYDLVEYNPKNSCVLLVFSLRRSVLSKRYRLKKKKKNL